MAVGPVLVGGREFGERLVLDDEQTGLFEVGLGDPPAAHEVAVEAVGEHFAEHAVGVGTCRPLEFLLAGVRVERQVQRLEHLLRNLVVGEALLASVGDGAPQCGAQQGDLHEVVEVAGLQRRVLAVVGERQELLGVVAQLGVGAQLANGGQRHDGGGRRATLRAEGGEPAEVAADAGRRTATPQAGQNRNGVGDHQAVVA